MNNPILRLDFSDALGKLKKTDNLFPSLMVRHYNVQIINTPDVLNFILSLRNIATVRILSVLRTFSKVSGA